MIETKSLGLDGAVLLLGASRFHLEDGILCDANHRPLALRAKSLSFLLFLTQASGRIVSKSELAEGVWPGLAVTDESISQCATDVRRHLGDRDHAMLETFPKRGYRLNAQVIRKADLSTKTRSAPIAAICIVAVCLTAWMWMRPDPTKAPPPLRDIIAVLPFQDAGGSADEAYIVRGLAEDLTIRLAELPGVGVVPSSLSFSVQGEGLAAHGAAQSLGARYVVDGSVYHVDQKIQISVELIDGLVGTVKWAEKYEGAPGQLLEIRNKIVEEIATAVSIVVSESDRNRIRRTGTEIPEAYQEILRGRQAAASFTREASLSAERHFRRALELDPAYARAYGELAAIYANRFENGWTVLKQADEEKAIYFATKALELDPDLWLAHYAMGRLQTVVAKKDLAMAQRHLERAMMLQPANDDARVYYAATKNFEGKVDEAIAILEPVLAAHPYPPFWYHLSLGNAYFNAERNVEAESAFDRCLQQMTSSPYCLRYQIANYALMGRLDDAEWLLEEYKILGFEASISAVMDLQLDQHPEQRSKLEAAFRAAGMSE